jgi:hypothetical protein
LATIGVDYLSKILLKNPPLSFAALLPPLELAGRSGADDTDSANLVGWPSQTAIASG